MCRSQDYSVKWNAQMSAHVLLDKKGGLKRVLARRGSGGADDWVLGSEKRATWKKILATQTLSKQVVVVVVVVMVFN